MPFRIVLRPAGRRGSSILGLLALAAALSGCALSEDQALFMVNRGKYAFYTCDQLQATAVTKAEREEELRGAMAKAAAGPGGALVNSIAYRSEYLTVKGELEELQITAREKKCREALLPQSTTAIR